MSVNRTYHLQNQKFPQINEDEALAIILAVLLGREEGKKSSKLHKLVVDNRNTCSLCQVTDKHVPLLFGLKSPLAYQILPSKHYC